MDDFGNILEIPQLAGLGGPDWEDIGQMFDGTPSLAFQQGWLDEPVADFRGGEVRVGWRPDALCVLARLDDDCVFSQASADGQQLWNLGDVFEIFVRDLADEAYLELHTAATGHRMQLKFESAKVIDLLRDRSIRFEELVVKDALFQSKVRQTPGGWEVFATVFAGALGGLEAGKRLLVSFSRYDYRDLETPPVLSSTSAHREINYHRQQEWREVRLGG